MKIIELFPINLDRLPDLLVYKLTVTNNTRLDMISGKLRYRLENTGGHWIWDDELQALIADTLVTEMDMETFLRDLRAGPDKTLFAGIKSVTLAPHFKISTDSVGKFVAKALLDDVSVQIREVLDQVKRDRGIYSITTHCSRRSWIVDGQPAVSITLQRTLDSKITVKEFIARFPQDGLVGLHVADITKPEIQSPMTITKVVGTLGEKNRRQWLLGFNPTPAIVEIIKQAGDGEIIVEADGRYHYPASALGVRILKKDCARFGISEDLGFSAKERVELLRPISRIIQGTGLAGEAFSEKNSAHLFISTQDIGHKPTLRFGDNQIGGTNRFECTQSFGLYRPKEQKKIRIAVLNAAPETTLEYLKTVFREKFQSLGYSLVAAGEQQIQRLTETSLEAAVSQLAKNRPDIVLAIIPEEYGSSEDTEWTIYDLFRQSILRHALQEQVVQPQAAGNLDIIHNLILGILAKTGHVPYVLASLIGYADFIIGLDWPADFRGQGSRDHAIMARVYLPDGQFDHIQVASRRESEKRAVQNLFPANKFAGKKIVLHRYGRFQDERKMLSDWGHTMGTTFYFVEIMRSATIPRIYETTETGMRAPKGTIFRLSETEALLVASQFLPDTTPDTPQPLHIKVYPPFSLRHALHSVLSFTLLHYNKQSPSLPVSIYYSNKILRMASVVKPGTTIPFWL